MLAETEIKRSDIFAGFFDKQLAYAQDSSRRKAALCTRRAGKTTMIARLHFADVLRTGKDTKIYAITRQRAKDLFWRDLQETDRQLGTHAKFNEVELSITLNGGQIKLTGADKLKEAEKARGDKLVRASLDEAQLYPAGVLKSMVDDIIGPTLEDYSGSLDLLGTPGPVCVGMWHDITTGEASGWSRHGWSVLDNPCFPRWAGSQTWRDDAREWLAGLKAERGWDDDHPTYRREWLGQWVNDFGALVYRFDPVRNSYDERPPHDWKYIVGSDLGFNDAFTCVVFAYSPDCDTVYEVETFKKRGMLPEQWAEQWRRVVETYKPIKIVVDAGALGKVIVEEAKNKYALPLFAAEKQHKLAAQEMINGELSSGRIKVRRGSEIAQEMLTLARDQDDPTKEDSRLDNHACDAMLYACRELLTYHRYRPQVEPKEIPADERYKQHLMRKMREMKEKPWWDRQRRY